ncbi:MAG: hypothetical protein H7842_15480, partial [Gammaproteobacteria bacterium SHHR-1]
MSKEKIILFGASVGGERGLKHLKRKYQVVGFCDNDSSKHSTTIKGIMVYAPDQLKDIEWDKIIICSMYYPEI